MAGLDRLWAGWRSDFVTGATDSPAPGGPACVFCRILAAGLADEDVHIVWRHPRGLAFALLNAYPYTTGHLMVMPVRHVAQLEELSGDEGADLWEGVVSAVKAIKAGYRPDGVNVGANLGRAAGAGVPGHFHMHVLPRWSGDTNFMTAVADARVLPEPLADSGAKLRACWPPG
jgi:diadenosine tetraphosphate (Ap4A) HIT family hydrolase